MRPLSEVEKRFIERFKYPCDLAHAPAEVIEKGLRARQQGEDISTSAFYGHGNVLVYVHSADYLVARYNICGDLDEPIDVEIDVDEPYWDIILTTSIKSIEKREMDNETADRRVQIPISIGIFVEIVAVLIALYFGLLLNRSPFFPSLLLGAAVAIMTMFVARWLVSWLYPKYGWPRNRRIQDTPCALTAVN
jgi:hypothetical protein